MNFIFGYILLVGAYIYGVPFIDNVLGEVPENGPAHVAGLKTGDRVLAINGNEITTFKDIRKEIVMNPDKDLLFDIERDGDFQRSMLTEDIEDLNGRTVVIQVTPELSLTPGELLEIRFR